jgi:hypothetical protein
MAIIEIGIKSFRALSVDIKIVSFLVWIQYVKTDYDILPVQNIVSSM